MSLESVFNPSLNKITKNILFLLSFILLALSLPTTISAHTLGQPPFLKINGRYAGYYDVPLTSTFFSIPQDKSPENYSPNSPINFEVDTLALHQSLPVLDNIVLRFEFGDGTTSKGIIQTHSYQTPGVYIVNIYAEYSNNKSDLIEAAILNVIPYKDYKLPQANILIDNKSVINPFFDSIDLSFNETHNLDSSQSTGNSPLKMVWDFGDESQGQGEVLKHTFKSSQQTSFIILRVTDTKGFYSDQYLQINNVKLNNIGTSISKVQTDFKRLGKNLFNYILTANISNPLISVVVLSLVFIAGSLHALTPGHGKSIMAAYLTGNNKSKYFDVAVIAISITLTHTSIVYILGFIFLVLDKIHTLTNVLPYFEKASAILVLFLGINMIKNSLTHHHTHEHHHDDLKRITRKELILTGISGGMIPCTDALAILLLLSASNHVALALLFVFIFSLGLALTIISLGLFFLFAKKSITQHGKIAHITEKYLPLISGALLIIISLRLIVL